MNFTHTHRGGGEMSILPYPFNPNQPTQDPNLSHGYDVLPKFTNENYTSYQAGQVYKGLGKKKKLTKKKIARKLKI
jgi:hypothetical protein